MRHLHPAHSIVGVVLLAAFFTSCETNRKDMAVETDAPFLGPSQKVEPAKPIRAESKPIAATPPAMSAGIPAPEKLPMFQNAPPSQDTAALSSNFDRRKNAWLTEKFRCRAISSVHLRTCRFEQHEDGRRLKFQMSDVVCEDVEFDDNGDPAKLTGCRSPWLRIPRKNKLKRGRKQDVWSGSHSGWRWKDGGKYCCPGMWIEAPKSIQEF